MQKNVGVINSQGKEIVGYVMLDQEVWISRLDYLSKIQFDQMLLYQDEDYV